MPFLNLSAAALEYGTYGTELSPGIYRLEDANFSGDQSWGITDSEATTHSSGNHSLYLQKAPRFTREPVLSGALEVVLAPVAAPAPALYHKLQLTRTSASISIY